MTMIPMIRLILIKLEPLKIPESDEFMTFVYACITNFTVVVCVSIQKPVPDARERCMKLPNF